MKAVISALTALMHREWSHKLAVQQKQWMIKEGFIKTLLMNL